MREVIITPHAEREILNIFEYLESKWNEKVKKDYSNKLFKVVQIVAKNPDLFPTSERNRKLRKCVITKQSSLFYHYNEKHIVVVSVFDTRQNPTKIKKIK